MTTPTCDDVIQAHVRHLGSQFSCYEEDSRLWIVSPYAHPDRDLVELTIRAEGDGLQISDLGETFRHLASVGADPRSTSKGEYLVSEILKDHGVELRQGVLAKQASRDDLGEAFQDVLSASLAVSQLVFLSRGFRPATFEEEVSQYLAQQNIAAQPSHVERGRTGKAYRIDFYATSREHELLLEALSATSTASTTSKVNAAFRLWSDVSNDRWRATLLDDRTAAWRTEDIALLEAVSTVYFWSAKDETLAAQLRQFQAGTLPMARRTALVHA